MVVVNIFIQEYAKIKIFIHFIISYYICLILNRKSRRFGGRLYGISGRKNDEFNKQKQKKKSLKPSHINGFKDFICGTLEGIRTPDLLVRSTKDKSPLHHFKPNSVLFCPLFTA